MTQTELSSTRKKMPSWLVATAFILLAGFIILIYAGYARSRPEPIKVGYPLPVFELTTFDGVAVHTADVQNEVVVINFWASWCEPCEQEAAGLENAWRSYQSRGDVRFIGVDYVDTEKEALDYIKTYALSYPNGPDLRSSISNAFRIRGVPETYIFDRGGKLVFHKIGPFTSTAEIIAIIDPLLE